MHPNIEARRNCYDAIPEILVNIVDDIGSCEFQPWAYIMLSHDLLGLPAEMICLLYDALLDGLNDYTTDERGDVGSIVRISCIRGLSTVTELLIGHSHHLPGLDTYFPADRYHLAVSAILKQGVERLDQVRREAGSCFLRLLYLPLPAVEDARQWEIEDRTFLQELFPR